MTAALAFALVVPAIAAVLLVGIAARKVLRDRTEQRCDQRRAELRSARADELQTLVGACLDGGLWRQTDLLEVIRRGDPALRDRLAAAGDTAAADAALLTSRSARDPSKRGRALLLAAWLRRPHAITTATGGLADADPDVRLAACAALSIIGTHAAARALVAALHSGDVPAARLVERLGAAWAVPALLEALPRASRGGPRAACLRALGLAGAEAAGPSVERYLSTGDIEERISAARALGQIGDRRLAPSLEAALADSDWAVRAQAAGALGAIGDPRATGALEHALTDDAWWVRANAARSLRALGSDGEGALRRAAAGADRFAAERAGEELHLLEALAA